MSAETELLWPGVALVLLLGAVASLCVRCSRPGAKRSEKIYEQRNLQENQQNFAVARTYSLARPGLLMDMASDTAPARKKQLRFSPSLEDSASPRYQNFSKGSRHGSDTVYIDPITMDCYSWGQSQKPWEDDDDANSYENVLICKQKQPDAGEAASQGWAETGDEESEDYQNSTSIQQWRESKRTMEHVRREAPPSPAGGPDEDDGEPDYVNGDVAAREA
ncbi:linker for activation of T-cells family member 2 isoform 1-T2 [Molossus nigricans]